MKRRPHRHNVIRPYLKARIFRVLLVEDALHSAIGEGHRITVLEKHDHIKWWMSGQ
jgi:hypothetical protein